MLLSHLLPVCITVSSVEDLLTVSHEFNVQGALLYVQRETKTDFFSA